MLLIFLAQPLQGAGNAIRGDAITGIDAGYLLDLALGKTRIAGDDHAADVCGRARPDTEQNVDLLSFGVLSFLVKEGGSVITVFLQQLLNALQGAIHLFRRERFSQLKFAGIHNLGLRWAIGGALGANVADEVIGGDDESEVNLAIGRAFGLHLNIGDAARVIDGLNALTDQIAA